MKCVLKVLKGYEDSKKKKKSDLECNNRSGQQ